MSNSVKLRPDGVIEAALVGDQTSESIASFVSQLVDLAKQQKTANRPVKLLSDSSKIGVNPPLKAWSIGVKALRDIPYDRVAVYGAPPFLKSFGRFVAKGLGHEDRMSYFETRDDAEFWLKEDGE